MGGGGGGEEGGTASSPSQSWQIPYGGTWFIGNDDCLYQTSLCPVASVEKLRKAW